MLLLLALVAQPAVEVGVFAALPAALATGQLIGPTASGSWASGGFALGGRARLGLAGEDDLFWHVAHTEVRLGAVGSAVRRIGRGDVALNLVAGGVVVHELRTRHQAARLEDASAKETSGWAGGPELAIEAAFRLRFHEAWGVLLEGGPDLSWLSGRDAPRLGWSLALSLSFGLPSEGAAP